MQFGVATRNVTPSRQICLAGYAYRDKPSEGVYQDLYVKALALRDDDDNLTVIVSCDLLYFDDLIMDPVDERIRAKVGLEPHQVIVTTSHTHCGPVVRKRDATLYGELDEEYLETVRNSIVDVVADASGNMQPCTLQYHRGMCDININRRVTTESGTQMLPNPDGIIDRDVDVLAVHDGEGAVRAVLFGYTCHATTMGGYLIGGDYPGFAQRTIQAALPGAEALFVQGCAGDIRPNNVDPANGSFRSGPLEVVEEFGQRLGNAALAALDSPGTDVAGSLSARRTVIDLPLAALPSREDVEAKLNDPSPVIQRWANEILGAMDRGEKLPTSVPTVMHTLTIGDSFALVTIAGEVCVEIGLRIKEAIGDGPRFVLGYTDRVHWYIPSRQILREGGYEADSFYYHGIPAPYDESVEDILVDTARELLGK